MPGGTADLYVGLGALAPERNEVGTVQDLAAVPLVESPAASGASVRFGLVEIEAPAELAAVSGVTGAGADVVPAPGRFRSCLGSLSETAG